MHWYTMFMIKQKIKSESYKTSVETKKLTQSNELWFKRKAHEVFIEKTNKIVMNNNDDAKIKIIVVVRVIRSYFYCKGTSKISEVKVAEELYYNQNSHVKTMINFDDTARRK